MKRVWAISVFLLILTIVGSDLVGNYLLSTWGVAPFIVVFIADGAAGFVITAIALVARDHPTMRYRDALYVYWARLLRLPPRRFVRQLSPHSCVLMSDEDIQRLSVAERALVAMKEDEFYCTYRARDKQS